MKKLTEKIQLFVLKKAELLLFLLFGLIYFAMAIFGRGNYWNSFEPTNLIAIILCFPIVFVINSYLFIPIFAKNNRWILYFVLVIVLFLCIEWARILANSAEQFLGKQNITIAFVLTFAMSWLFITTRDWFLNLRLIEKLKAENLITEIAFLKAQVDPHFMFNTLNAVYALALEEESPKTADSIIKLSTLMRYNLHDSNAEFISIEKEIDYIEKYIALQTLRLNKNNHLDVDIKVDADVTPDIKIAPLLLITFIENAFKYGVSPSKETAITIRIHVAIHLIELEVSNTVIINTDERNLKGIGLQNVKKRLNLLYPKLHTLVSKQSGEKYFTQLVIKFQK
ncbi:MAG: histidine kinase [Chitinophagales bacterium]|nr:histidine kinase [Bacteroidota bacterium]MBP7398411.1 histidine kinase [Chitinophagales bacterium]MBK8488843.1 histidine kinase [Bacteroidota bacterium]MBK8680695.1 histidine kinase [Bacteroidota bacterium]MBP8753690.1 histidine kinase [Chitinophagales bacterium]